MTHGPLEVLNCHWMQEWWEKVDTLVTLHKGSKMGTVQVEGRQIVLFAQFYSEPKFSLKQVLEICLSDLS